MAPRESAITRDEFESMPARMSALESSLSDVDQRKIDRADAVHQNEFRLFKWLGTFALVTVMAGFSLLYEQVSDLRVAMERMHAEMERMHAEILGEMHAQHTAIRDEISSVRERVVSLETRVGGAAAR